MRFVSLFAGVGGFDLGLERAGMTCVGQVEIDKHAREILARHWPNVPSHDDVRTAKEWADQNGITGNVELVCGGFPCQDVSVAGRRAGLAGNRTGLFWDALNFATHVQAQWIILENVPGLFSSNNGHDFPTVIGALRDAGFHYVEWRVFDSQFYGVPQRRRRVFIVGHTRNPSRFPLFVERKGSPGDSETGQPTRQTTPGSIKDGIGSRVFGESSFGQFAERISTLKASGGVLGGGSENLLLDTYVKAARAQSADSPETWRADQVHPTVNAFDTGDTRATALVVFPIQSTVIGRADHNGPQGKGYGLATDAMFTIDRVGAHGVAITEGQDTEEQKAIVRRLTPIECERLQGFPDGWTDGQADSHRYKQMGNAVTVNVAEVVGRFIMDSLK